MKKVNIIPAILEKRFSAIEKKVRIVENMGISMVQIDICDGELTPSKTFASGGNITSFEKIKNISKTMGYELDMLVNIDNNRTSQGNRFLSVIDFLEPKRVIFHFSGVGDWDKIFQNFEKSKTKVGLGIWLSDDVKKVLKVLDNHNFDYIQIMAIEKVGYGGQEISPKVFAKAKYFHKKYPNLPIQIDGGVKVENVQKLYSCGVTGFVAGSGIYSASDVKERIEDFKKEAKKA